MAKSNDRVRMDIVIAGHVDHGKSTVIGRLLADTNSLPQGKLEQVKANCERNSKPFEYAFLLDALKDEQSQGITIDAARVFFKTPKRDYIIIDAPGHIEFLKNMVTGASRAESALLVIDADEGVQENSRRHGYLISMIGIKQMVVLVNKMDLVDYSREVFDRVTSEYRRFLADIGLECDFVPVSGMQGDNIATLSERMSWYRGRTVLEVLDNFTKEPPPVDKALRVPVQDIYKFTKAGDKRRIVAGNIEAGTLSVGDRVVFYPSGKQSTVKTIETFNVEPPDSLPAGYASSFTLTEQIYVGRGELAVKADQLLPEVTNRVRVNIFWMGRSPLVKDKSYLLKVGTASVQMELEEVVTVIDGSDLKTSRKKEMVEYHDVAECVLRTRRPIAFDLAENIAVTSRFVIVDDYEIRGGGIIREALKDTQEKVRDYVMQRNYRWATSRISRDDRAERYSQKASLIIITGPQDVGKKTLARAMEARLFGDGKFVYFLGIGNILYGVDADIKVPGRDANRPEHLRRLAEVANIMLDAGMILVVTAVGLDNDDFEIIRTSVDTENIYTVWLGDEPTDLNYDMLLDSPFDLDIAIDEVKGMLQQKGIIFKP